MTKNLKATYRPISRIDVHEIRQMYGIYSQYYENTSWDIFLHDLSKKTGAFIMHCPEKDRVVGFSTVMTCDLMVQGKKERGIFSGDTILEKAYWGSRALQIAFFKFVLAEKVRHPRQKMYWLLISKGFKTYLLLANNFHGYYPHPDNEHSHLAEVIDTYCTHMFPDYYDQEKRILDFGADYSCLKGDAAPITEAMRRDNRKIRFFEECNPEWARGTELPCIGVIDSENIVRYVLRYLTKTASKGLQDAQTARQTAEIRPLRTPTTVQTLPLQRRA